MSWLFSQALVEEFSAATSSAGEPSAQLNVMPTAHPFWRRDKTTEFCPPSRSGLTCAVLTADRGEKLLTWFRAASPAQTSVQPEKELASKEANPVCGETWRESWLMFDRDTFTWRTPQCSLLGDSESFSGTWPRWGSMLDGVCSGQAPSVFRTSANESGFVLPTPSGVNGGRNNMMGRIDEWGGSSNPLRGTVIGSMCLPPFEEMAMGWPIGWTELTPFAMDKFQQWLQQHGKY